MSKFLTPPVWYDKNGSEIKIFDNTTYNGVVESTAIGTSAVAGSEGSSRGAVAVGSQAQAKKSLSIAIGSYNDDNFQTVQALAYGSIAIGGGAKANAGSTDGIAIGSRAISEQGGIAIGGGASATSNQIRLGNPNVIYDLKIGSGNGVVDGYIREGLYVPTSEEGFYAVTYDSDIYIQTPINGGIYIIRVQSPNRGTLCSLLFEFNAYNTTYSLPFNYYNAKDDTMQAFIKAKPHDHLGKAVLEVVDSVSNTANILHNFEISVRLISQPYGTG
jgi:hypothetical protein